MSLLGFDALGRWALGQLPGSSNAALIAGTGSFALQGQVSTFRIAEAEGAGAFGFAGIASQFKLGGGSAVGSYALTGRGVAFNFSVANTAGGYVLTGTASRDLIGEPVNPAGAIVLSGLPATYAIAFATTAASFGSSGSAAALRRDFVNWFPRPLDVSQWSTEDAPSTPWSAVSSLASSWSNESAPSPEWSPLSPPSSAWTVDPIQQIPPPVSE